MKKIQNAKQFIAVCLALGMALLPANVIKALAAEVVATVEGTVLSGTTSDILKLSTREGDMEIKLDSGTDTSACKILLPDKKISVSVSHGSDGYMHAVKITGEAQASSVSVDASTTATVTGTLSEDTKSDILYVDTPQGQMEIKLDPTTNISGCSVLIAGKSYSITCARGSDAYMHAVSISDGTGGTSGLFNTGSNSSVLTPAPASAINASTSTVTGKVSDNTRAADLLYLKTNDGEMQIVIDADTDSRGGMVLTPGNKLTVSVYRGSDAYMHAAVVTGNKDGYQSVEIDTSSPATVTGTVGSKSTENILFLDTPQGQMELKLDCVRSVTNCKVLVSGSKLTLTCARGSDAYMHALDITGA